MARLTGVSGRNTQKHLGYAVLRNLNDQRRQVLRRVGKDWEIPIADGCNTAADSAPSRGEFTWRNPCALEFDCWQEVTEPDITAWAHAVGNGEESST